MADLKFSVVFLAFLLSSSLEAGTITIQECATNQFPCASPLYSTFQTDGIAPLPISTYSYFPLNPITTGDFFFSGNVGFFNYDAFPSLLSADVNASSKSNNFFYLDVDIFESFRFVPVTASSFVANFSHRITGSCFPLTGSTIQATSFFNGSVVSTLSPKPLDCSAGSTDYFFDFREGPFSEQLTTIATIEERLQFVLNPGGQVSVDANALLIPEPNSVVLLSFGVLVLIVLSGYASSVRSGHFRD